ncbi:MAG: translation initiation factor IF-2, partial [Lachnospiraceae bacterium]|nr:translation initiation factor IF-2 [Lachnospiraceae bacterium]
MAKMKVHELAKELDRKSKELIDFLQAKGYEVKVAQSSIEDDAIALVRKEFSSSGDKVAKAVGEEKQSRAEEKPRSEEPSVKEKTAPAAGGEKAAPAKSAPERPAAESEKRDGKGEAPKKKRIIFVSNPHNSKMGGRQSQGGGNGQGGQNSQNNQNRGGSRPMSNGARPVQPQNTPHKIIRPTQKPIPVTAEPYDVRQKQQQERRLEQRQQEKRQQEKRQQEKRQQEKWQQEKRDNNKNTAAGNKPAPGQGRVESAGENRRPEGQSRPNYSGGQGDRGRGGAPNAYGRNAGGGDRPQRGNGGPDNRFKKNNGPKDFVAEAPAKDAEKHRDDEKRRVNQDRDKRSKKDHIYEEDDAAVKNRNKAGRFIKPEKKAEASKEEQIKVITVPDTLTIKELADKMKIQPSAIIKKLFLQGQIVTLNSDISFEEAENIAIEYEIICEKEVKVDVIEELLREEEEDASTMVARPPVICVMGHVDHGKTSLLDAIRKTNVTDKEAGGITQAIGAYTVSVKGQSITFLDTPGHEAFTAMRMRGANSTDIAVLVVAADDGVMPQTVEAINHAKAAGIEIIVAVNKIDKPNANIDRVKQEMTEYELIPVDWGGSTEFVPVSAKSGEGIENLLETILLTAEILELKANPDRNARGLVIEAELDKGRGPVATVLVQKGTLHVGDFISAGASHGKVRAMIDDKGRRVREAKPSTPVEILGLSDVPSAGEVFIVHENDKSAKSYAETYMAQHKEEMLADTKTKMSLDDLFNQIQ